MLNLTRVKSRAKLKGISLVDLSLQLGRQRSYLYDVQSKGLKVSKDTLEQLAEILETTPDYLEDETDNPDIVRDTDEFVDIYRLVNNRPSTKLLFSALKGASDEDIKRTIEILNALKRTNGEL